jgi:hypothetical protein
MLPGGVGLSITICKPFADRSTVFDTSHIRLRAIHPMARSKFPQTPPTRDDTRNSERWQATSLLFSISYLPVNLFAVFE